nr:hypothetical protein [Tanacetum cinerariifolium]
MLSIEDNLNYLEQPIPPVLVAPAGQQVTPEILTAHIAWVKRSKEIAGLMLMTIEPEIQRNLEPLHAHEMLKEQEEGQSVSSYVLKIKSYIDNLERLGYPVTLGLGVRLILIVLRKEYVGFVQNYNMHSMGKTVNELHAMLKLHEQTLPKSNAPAFNAIRAGKVQKRNKYKKSHSQNGAKGQNQGKGKFVPKPKIPPPPKKENPAKNSICHEAGGSGIFVIELNNILNRSWIYDTGCAVEAIGAFYLCLPSGLEIVLNNCHYAPSITRGVISISRLYEDGFVNRFVDNTIQVSRNNVVYFCAIPRDGIFEIDLSNSLTNESSIYAVRNKRAKLDLDSALLWHCRLGHISKKRIEKLQHDGLLNSSDLTAFEKCVSCMSGKMARKPYTHQVERAKDLLGLIHIDDHGIIAHRTPPYTLQHNGVLERRNRTLLDIVRSMMSQTTLPKSFWDYVLDTAASILNMVLTKKALVKRDTLTKPDKLEPRAIKCIFVGYPKEMMGYSFYYPLENKVLVARNAEFLENIQDEDTHPSLDTSLNHEEEDLEIDESQSDIVPIRRSTRTRHAPDRMCLYIDAEEHKLWDLGEPANYKAALLDLDKWLFKKKTDMDGNVHIYKARLVAKGFTQTLGINYEETFSRVADTRAIRILIAIAALKQASRQWNKRFDDEIKKFGFTQNRDEPCYSNALKCKTYLGKCFAMKDLGEAAYILGIKIYRDRSNRLIGLCQSAYIEKILERYCMENSKRESIPMHEKLKLSKSQGASTPAEMKRMHNVPYASTVGSIMYAMRCTCPDVAFAQNITSQFQQNPGDIHWTTVKNILKYLRNTKDMFLVYRGDLKQELRVSCYTDAGYLTDTDDLKSRTRYVFVLNCGAIDWKSAKQSIFATSSAEAEYIAAFDASKEAV